jgi:hypothetical protein
MIINGAAATIKNATNEKTTVFAGGLAAFLAKDAALLYALEAMFMTSSY